MKKTLFPVSILCILLSCNNDTLPIVDGHFVDSLISHYQVPKSILLNQQEIDFWKSRINPSLPGITSELKYASLLMQRFHLQGDINDARKADSILLKVDSFYNHKEASPNIALAKHCIAEHRFKDAANYFTTATAIGLKPYDFYATSFDINFELGNYNAAFEALKAIRKENDYGYKFRQSKWEHYKANIDSSIAAMKRASLLSDNNIYLQQAALSNTADLYLHSAGLQNANDLYTQSIKLDAGDLHSLMGIGWIALVHDKNDLLAEKIFSFVRTKTLSPEPLYKLSQEAEANNDSVLQRKYALDFVTKTSGLFYGNMYNKYLIELFTGILNNPEIAEKIAMAEIENRRTPQTYAWYAFTLLKNNKKEEAYKIYKGHVAGKPLETIELYWMVKLMQGLDKPYLANEFFKAAYKNRYDLSPGKIKDLETIKGII
jgi:hypothetical protein